MNRKYYSALAMSAVAMGAVVLTATEASATVTDPQPRSGQVAPPVWPDEGTGYPGSETATPEYNYPSYAPQLEVAHATTTTAGTSSDGNGFEFVQSGASALGGAALALSGVWLYRRRQPHTA